MCIRDSGTLDEAVSGMMESEEKTLLGYIPAGSTNDFANSLRIPKSMLKAANVAVKGRRFPVDIGYFNGDSLDVYKRQSRGSISCMMPVMPLFM